MDNTKMKKPISNDSIYKIMLWLSFSTASVFFIKDLLGKLYKDAIIVGIALAVFSIIILVMKKLNINKSLRQFLVSIFIVFLVFMISINSGNFYSDDFPLYLAVIGITGLYMNPIYSITQTILIDILLMVAYFLHPEKADPIGQYIMCVVVFTLAASTFYMVIKRGNAYIKLAEYKIEQANKLLDSIKKAGFELQENCEKSSDRVTDLTIANSHLEEKTYELQLGSKSISEDTKDVVNTFESVKTKVNLQKKHVDVLNTEVKDVEQSLSENKNNLSKMSSEIKSVNNTFASTTEVFATLQENVKNISAVTKRLSDISYNTTILALNASIEAARAGDAGKGFAVVADNVQTLAKDSTECSEQVFEVINQMNELIDKTSIQIIESSTAISSSVVTLDGFENSFNSLAKNFNSLYDNIEMQNSDIKQMNEMVENLKARIEMMSKSSQNNQDVVSSISEAMDIYQSNINHIVADSKQINELSASLLSIASKE